MNSNNTQRVKSPGECLCEQTVEEMILYATDRKLAVCRLQLSVSIRTSWQITASLVISHDAMQSTIKVGYYLHDVIDV